MKLIEPMIYRTHLLLIKSYFNLGETASERDVCAAQGKLDTAQVEIARLKAEVERLQESERPY